MRAGRVTLVQARLRIMLVFTEYSFTQHNRQHIHRNSLNTLPVNVRITLPIAPPDKREEMTGSCQPPMVLKVAEKRFAHRSGIRGWPNIDDAQLQGSPKLFMAIQERNGVWCKGAHRIFFNSFETQSTARLAAAFHDNTSR